ncbi:metallophosphoesterase [Lacinutrix neustonica]|uniref:Metallophosphoesterase n=1 Tax=Lacinutrix neustonica TaxID=2980107 RepID=A0A9E8SCN4_9FLAO|nr:metallophosphoesterase [Lacinutrix neustonica]WAC01518.1 metallophosphoesterase [Lacinutrix neustonica]
MSRSINILHLTDFHLDNKVIKDFDLLMRKPLKEDVLKRANGNIDLLFITGDIVDRGGNDFGGLLKGLEISNKKVISQIAKDLNLKEESVFIIPGNHDINRYADKDFIDEGLRRKLKTSEKINNFIDSVNGGDFTGVERLMEYREFEKKFYSAYKSKIEDTFFHSTFIKNIYNCDIGISCFNSAWRCYSEEDDGNLLIGERQVLESVNLIQDCEMKIALVHHHVDSLSPDEKDTMKSILTKNYDLIFFGHSHRHNNYSRTCGGNQSIWVGSPSSFLNARTDSKKYSYGYSLCTLSKIDTKIQYSHFSYSNTDYRTNTEIGNDGYDKMYPVIKSNNTKINTSVKKNNFSYIPDIPNTVIENVLSNIGKPSKLFTGRKDKLKEVKDSLETNEIICVNGIGGIGKTQLILKFLENYDKSRITWQEFSENTRFDTFIVASGFEFIIQSGQTETEKFSALLDKLNEYKRIVIWDNFHDNNDDTFLRFLNYCYNKLTEVTKIIIVSRTNLLIKSFKSIKLVDFNESEEYARALIKERHKGLKLKENEIKEICTYVKGHPLALELALSLCVSISYKKVIGKLAMHSSGVDELSQRIFQDILDHESTSSIEKEFLYKFSAFKGRVSESDVEAVFEEKYFFKAVPQLADKYLIEYQSGFYDTHPLIHEFCYDKLENKEELHYRIASCLISQRNTLLDTLLEERIFHHLKGANNLEEISRTIEKYGRDYIREAFFEPLQEMISFVESSNVKKPLFYLLIGDIHEIKGEYDLALLLFEKAKENKVNEELAVEGLLKYANIQRRKGLTKISFKLFEKAKSLSIEKNFTNTLLGHTIIFRS